MNRAKGEKRIVGARGVKDTTRKTWTQGLTKNAATTSESHVRMIYTLVPWYFCETPTENSGASDCFAFFWDPLLPTVYCLNQLCYESRNLVLLQLDMPPLVYIPGRSALFLRKGKHSRSGWGWGLKTGKKRQKKVWSECNI